MKAEVSSRAREKIAFAILASLDLQIAAIDSDGVVIEVNESWMRFGRENGASDISSISPGVNYLEVCRRAIDNKSEDARSIYNGIETVLNGSRESFSLEYACHSPAEKRWFCVVVTPLGAPRGGAVIAHENITRRVDVEYRFQQSERYYEALIENTLDIVSIVNSAGKILYVSAAVQRVLGYAPGELPGSAIIDYIHRGDRSPMRRMLREVNEKPEMPHTTEFRVRHAQGHWRYVEIIGKRLPSEAMDRSIILNFRDITERREAAEELRKKEAALNRSHAQLRALTGRVLVAEDAARRRISRELHDDLNQRLAMIAVNLGKISGRLSGAPVPQMQQELRDLQQEVSKLSDDVRSTAHYLHPSSLDDLGVVVAVQSLCEDFSQRSSIEVKFLHRGVSENLRPGLRASIYRIVQECLWNVSKHAQSRSAVVSLTGIGSRLRVGVRDYGVGFDPASAPGKGGLGLISIEERARMFGGAMRIRSVTGRGCHVTVEVPVEEGENATSPSPARR